MTERRARELERLSDCLGVKFSNLTLLHEALTHSSYAHEKKDTVPHNERLEFLGDAVLELATSTYLYERYPNLPEGDLTRLRASIVCSQTLSKLATGLHLGDYLLLGHGEEAGGGRTRTSNLENVFEAVIGAVYLDAGWEVAHAYVLRHMKEEFSSARAGKSWKDYKTTLQEIIQKTPDHSIRYELLEESGPDHNKTYRFSVKIDEEVYGEGIGHSKKSAEQDAAREALERIKNNGNKKNS